ncbi:MAG: protease complex subunit PrcB family protein [Gammaproteobacteria bacterium]
MNSNVMKTLTAIATLALLLAGCASMGGGSSSEELLASGQHSNIKDQQYTDIHNQVDLDALWQKAFANMSAPTKPVVDFSKQMVIAAFAGEQETSGWVVRVSDVDDSGPTLNVTVTVTVPGRDCLFTKNKVSQPYGITAIPASNKQVHFNIKQHNAAPCSS